MSEEILYITFIYTISVGRQNVCWERLWCCCCCTFELVWTMLWNLVNRCDCRWFPAMLSCSVWLYELFSQNIYDSMGIQGISLESFPCYFFQKEMKFSLLKSRICVSQNMCCDGWYQYIQHVYLLYMHLFLRLGDWYTTVRYGM